MAEGGQLAVRGWQMLGSTLALVPLLAQAAGKALTGHLAEAKPLVDNALTAWQESINEIQSPSIQVAPNVSFKSTPGTKAAAGKFFDSLEADWENLRHSVKLITLDIAGTNEDKNAEEERHQLALIAIEEQHVRAKLKTNELSAYDAQEQLRQLGIKRQIVAETRKETDAAQRVNQQTLATREFQNTLLNDAVEKERMLTDDAARRLDSDDNSAEKAKAKLTLQLAMSQRIYELQRDGLLKDTTLLNTQRAAELLKLDLARQREQTQLRTLAATEQELAAISNQRALRDDAKSGAASPISSAFAGNHNGSQIGSTLGSLSAKALGGIAAGPIGLAVAEGVGGLIGGLVGHKKDQEQASPVVKGLSAIERAQRETITAIQAQTDALLNPENRLMDLPTDFNVPRYMPNVGGGSTTNVSQTNNISLNITVPSGKPDDIRTAVRDAMGDVLNEQRRSHSWN